MTKYQKISVVIPTCNRSELLEETIRSVARQSRKPDEVIIVNNGDTPVELPAQKDLNLIVQNVFPFCGASAARNYGSVAASGEILAFLDDDDLWEPDYLLKMEKALKEANVALCRLDQLLENNIGPWKSITAAALNFKVLIRENPGVTGSNIVIRKNTFLGVGGFDVGLKTSEDKSLLIELIRHGEAIMIVQNCQAIHRQHHTPGRLTSSKPMVEGISQFKTKYGEELDWKERYWLEYKICLHKRSDKQRYNFIVYWFGRMLTKIRMIP